MLSMLRPLLAIAAALSLSNAAAAKPPRITSAYTKVGHDRCKVIESSKDIEGIDMWSVSRCEGLGGIPLFLTDYDLRDDLDAGVRNEAAKALSGPFHSVGETVEWRLADGRPFAIIFRVDASPAQWSHLIVETIGKPGKPGCPIAKFDALKPSANVAARRAADVILAGKAPCIEFDE